MGFGKHLSGALRTMLYFAYGSNMDFGQMRKRCPSAITVTRATLRGYQLAFTRFSESRQGGVADVVRQRGSVVEGVMYEISDDDAARLDEYEGVADNCYRRIQVRVTLPAGEVMETYAYKATEQGLFQPSKAYMQHLITGAKYHRLSPEYIGMLEAIQTADAEPAK
ncbi:MAG: gamma-glutamylcyclotransferase [Candidatus Coatesbacteria bacterium]|nr:gamma-glutamylcyclotransferase [Candidatus Coatesbacteria bacterium]